MIHLSFAIGHRDRLETLHPAYFAMVMATGIVAIASHIHALPIVPRALLWLNVALFLSLVIAMARRGMRYPQSMVADMASHSRGVGFFTWVAATGVLGTQFVVQIRAVSVATTLWGLACVLWLVITYGIMAALTVKEDKPAIADGLNGGWLVIVVATQSVSILTVNIAATGGLAPFGEVLMFWALILWLGGGALYLWLISLIFMRYTFLRMAPDDLTPPYWINMGAVAISTLAGGTLVGAADLSPVIQPVTGFVTGLTLFYWAIASWWIPMLLLLGIWRYVLKRVPVSYDPLYWGGVFPLGMYSVCTNNLTGIIEAPFLNVISAIFLVVALAAWTATLIGLVVSRLTDDHS